MMRFVFFGDYRGGRWDGEVDGVVGGGSEEGFFEG